MAEQGAQHDEHPLTRQHHNNKASRGAASDNSQKTTTAKNTTPQRGETNRQTDRRTDGQACRRTWTDTEGVLTTYGHLAGV